MSKNNRRNKEYEIDEFAQNYCGQNARLRQLKEEKHRAKQKNREKNQRGKRHSGEDDYEE